MVITIRNSLITRETYRGMVTGTDGLSALVFGSNSMMRRLGETTDICVGSSICIVPMMYILYEHQSTPQFVAVWQFILGLQPTIETNLSTAICAYGSPVVLSIRQIFPRVTITGCWLFYRQALY